MSPWVKDTIDLINGLGISTYIILALGVAAWRIIKWMAPRVDKLVEGHNTMMAKVGDSAIKSEMNQRVVIERLDTSCKLSPTCEYYVKGS